MYPIKLNPVFKEIVWGGERLKSDYGFKSDLKNIAEAWMLCARNDGDNVVVNGEFSGNSFTDVISLHKEYLGSKGSKYGEFPLLIKFIDAKSDLSVQVHPDDEYARIHENSFGKTEAWYILDCDEGASLIYGFKDKISKDEFRSSISDNSFLDKVNKVEVHKGDVFFIGSGTLHAIGGGILLAEVQQNCNTTYRVYDYNRLVNGKPRDLHIDKAVDVTITDKPSPAERGADSQFGKALCTCEFFSMYELNVKDEYKFNVNGESFVSLLVLDGCGSLTSDYGTVDFKKGDSIFLPANLGNIEFKGDFSTLVSTL